jgi:hypothetical protein
MRAITPIRVVLLALVLVCGLSANIGSPTASQDNHFLGVLLSSTNATGTAGYNAYSDYDTKPNSGSNHLSQGSPLSGFAVSSGTAPKSANFYVFGPHEFAPEHTGATPEPSYLPMATGIMLFLAFLKLRMRYRRSR